MSRTAYQEPKTLPSRGTKGLIRHYGKLVEKGIDLIDLGMTKDARSPEDLLRLAAAVEASAIEFRNAVEARYGNERITFEMTEVVQASSLIEGDTIVTMTSKGMRLEMNPSVVIVGTIDIDGPIVTYHGRRPSGKIQVFSVTVDNSVRRLRR